MKTLKLFSLAVVILGFTSVSFAQTPKATAAGDAYATIIEPIAIANITSLRFGNIIASNEEGTVIISPEGDRKSEGGAYFPTAVLGDFGAAEFVVTGLIDATYNIVLPGSFDLEGEGGGIKIYDFKHNAKRVLKEGKESFKLGASLNIPVNQKAGDYKGSFNVTVNYN